MADTVKHTPGPWKVFNGTDVFPDDDDREGERQIADCSMSHAMTFEEENANARLIAAAPELLEAIRPFLAAYEAYVLTHRGFIVDGVTSAERRFSKGERRDAAEEAAFEALASITFDQLSAVSSAIAKAEGR